MTTEHRRTVVKLAQETAIQCGAAMRERHACTLTGLPRATHRYLLRRTSHEVLRARLRAFAAELPRWGYRRLVVLLRREGHAINHKLVHRLYREEGLAVRRRRKKRTAVARAPLAAPMRPNERWSLDFVSDALADGRKFRALTLVDAFTRESLAIEVDTSLPGEHVVRVLERAIGVRGLPAGLTVDNGPELAGKAMDQWAYRRGVVADARFHIERYRIDYNEVRPHQSLEDRTPAEFARIAQHTPSSTTLTPGLSQQVA